MVSTNSTGGSISTGNAWVIGGSIAGLLAARALSDHYETVRIVERDSALGEPTPRRGAPQGRHVHALLPRGVNAVEKMFPGITEEIINAGAVNGDLCEDAQWCPGGLRLKRSKSNMRVIAASRPFVESFVAKRVAEVPNIQTVTDTVGVGFDQQKGRVTGIQLRDRDGNVRTESADAIVDATGRASKLPAWLVQHGLKKPPEDRIDVKLNYATARFRLSTAKGVNLYAAIVGASPDLPRGGIAQTVEKDVLQVSMAEYGDAPPTEMQDFVEYARTLPQPDLFKWMEGAEPLDEVKTQKVPASYRRHFDRVRHLPDGLLALGDAVCAFNPVYAQGMTVAAVEAEILNDCLAAGHRNISRRYFKAIRSVTDVTWQMGSTNDLSLPVVTGDRSLIDRVVGRWIHRVQIAGTKDSTIAEKFIRVAALLDSPNSLLSPRFAWRVLRTA